MPGRRVIPINERSAGPESLIWAAGRVLAREGFEGLTVDGVCQEAGVPRKILYRHYGGLRKLLEAFRATSAFWPTTGELVGDDAELLKSLPPPELMSEFFKRYLHAMLRRPQTLDILAWETRERNDLTRVLEVGRERSALEFFEQMQEDPPNHVDLSALVALVAGAVNFLAVRSRRCKVFGGIDLRSELGWKRIEETIDLLFARTLEGRCAPRDDDPCEG